jgi:hypothetical protein
MTTVTLDQSADPSNPCAGCAAIELDRTASARELLLLAAGCTCGCVTLGVVAELAAYAIEDLYG